MFYKNTKPVIGIFIKNLTGMKIDKYLQDIKERKYINGKIKIKRKVI